MGGARVHFEVFVRRKPGASWTLELATENRALAISNAEDTFKDGGVHAVKVTKETQDPETGEFQTVSILNLGMPEPLTKRRAPPENLEPLCVTPQDLYSLHARDRIGRLLEGWLARKSATPFELLHRPDLVEHLEASGNELQHAVQKIAVPEAQARGGNVHEMMRTFHGLIDRTVDRLMKDWRRGALPDLSKETFAVAAERLAGDPDGPYLLGCGVAMGIAGGRDWTEKLSRLMDFAAAAPPAAGPARRLAITVLQQPIAEILESRAGLEGIVGKTPHLGASLAALTRLAAADSVDMLIKVEKSVAKVMPELSTEAKRLGRWLGGEDFVEVRTALGKRILTELNGPRRLVPGDAALEIDVLRALAMSLTAAAGKLLPLEDVQAAFSVRSKMLVTGDFVESYLGQGKTAREEAEALVWLTENVIGPQNKRHAARWLKALVTNNRLEKETLASIETPPVRLAALAALQRSVGRCGLAPEDAGPVQEHLGIVGGKVEAEARLIAALTKATAPAVQKLTFLLRLASGETAPLGPAADRARSEAMRLVRDDGLRSELAQAPDQMAAVRDLVEKAQLAA
ncbi:hypothetical protein [Phenylobacterium sp.]|uniref:hypothetical protein n=1 Tax=Phenylobacterium sp. TaxID=1871053 RepID=UPI002B8C9EA9|nr:hypothetical protein [Phenylobacterium sp.]HVI31823.1 hypothetical protein [Phenylobacterium sp.]